MGPATMLLTSFALARMLVSRERVAALGRGEKGEKSLTNRTGRVLQEALQKMKSHGCLKITSSRFKARFYLVVIYQIFKINSSKKLIYGAKQKW